MTSTVPIGVTRWVPDPAQPACFVSSLIRGRIAGPGRIEGYFRNGELTVQVAVRLHGGQRRCVAPSAVRAVADGGGAPC